MKIQHLAIVFIIIILPISLLIGEYIHSQIDTITLQTSYNNKLQTATHDAMLAFKLNTLNNDYSSISDSKLRDVEASINSFYKSLGREIRLNSYYKEELTEYTPALLYTMYDGFYIYSKYKNVSTNQYEFGLKPYVYYACRYIDKNNPDRTDFTVNYTLDNYITIYGTIGGQYYAKAGNIINLNDIVITKNNSGKITNVKYQGVDIEREELEEQVLYFDLVGEPKRETYKYIIYNNNKIYLDENLTTNRYFVISNNNKKQYIVDSDMISQLDKHYVVTNGTKHFYSDSAMNYYIEAYDFTNWVKDHLSSVTQKWAVDEYRNEIKDFDLNTGDSSIFDYSKFGNYGDLGITDSVFDLNRIAVIRRNIKYNLLIAIKNYNNLSGNTSYEYVLPEFNEESWYNICNNISMVSFLQGVPIGTKYYNNYCVITNNKNKELVNLDSLYVITKDNTGKIQVHKPNCKDLIDNPKLQIIKAYKSIDFERKSVDTSRYFYYPHADERCYDCLVNGTKFYGINYKEGKVKQYNKTTDEYEDKVLTSSETDRFNKLRKEILTAIARESYDLYKINNYFKGYNENESLSTIEDTSTALISINPSLSRNLVWNNNKTSVTIKKSDDVGNTAKIEYQLLTTDGMNPFNENLINNSIDENNWIKLSENDNSKTLSGLWINNAVVARLDYGTYKSDTVKMIIKDAYGPGQNEDPQVVVTSGKNQNGYYVGDYIELTITSVKDKESGVKDLSFECNSPIDILSTQRTGNEYSPITKRVRIKNTGNVQLKIITTDYAGLTNEKTVSFKKALEDPIIEVIGTPTLELQEGGQTVQYYNGNVGVQIKYSNNNQGELDLIDRISYKIGDRSGKNITEDFITGKYEQITESGVIKITAQTIGKPDENANVNISPGVEKTIVRDLEGPKINSLVAKNITTSSFDLELIAIDSISGISRIDWYYKRDGESYLAIGNPNQVTTCSGEKTAITKSINVTGLRPGNYKATAMIYDRVGNYSTKEISITVKNIDKEPKLDTDPSGPEWKNVDVTVKKSNDTVAYLNINPTLYIEYTYDNPNNTYTKMTGDLILSSTRTIYYRFTDGVNKGGVQALTVGIDKQAPSKTTVTLTKVNPNTGAQSTYISGTLTNEYIRQTFTATDTGGSGIAYYECSHDGVNVGETVQSPWLIDWDIPYGKFYIRAVDSAGNRGQWSDEYYLYIQKENSNITVTYLEGENKTGWQKSVKLKLSTTTANLAKFEISWNGNGNVDSQTAENFNPWSGCTYENVKFRVVDSSGNTYPWTTEGYSIKMDGTAPELTNNLTATKNGRNVTLNLKAKDVHSGLGRVEWYKIVNGNKELVGTTVETGTVNVEEQKTITYNNLPDNAYTFCARVYDKVGNYVDSQQVAVQLSEPYYAINNGQVVAAPNAELVHNGGLSDYGVWTNVPGYGVRGLKNSSIHYEATTGNIETKGCKWISITGGYFMEANPCNAVLEVIDSNTGNVKYSESISSAGSLTDNIGKEYDISDCEKVKVRLYIQTDDSRDAWTNIWLTNVNFHD